MGKNITKELKEQFLTSFKKCIGKKCYIVKEVEPSKQEGILVGIHPTSNKALFKLISNDKYEFLIIDNDIFIFVEK